MTLANFAFILDIIYLGGKVWTFSQINRSRIAVVYRKCFISSVRNVGNASFHFVAFAAIEKSKISGDNSSHMARRCKFTKIFLSFFSCPIRKYLDSLLI